MDGVYFDREVLNRWGFVHRIAKLSPTLKLRRTKQD